MKPFLTLCLALLPGLPAAAWAASPFSSSGNPQALRLAPQTAIAIDGRLDEPAWQRAPQHGNFVQFLPEDKQPARWRTTVQILASEDALIFGIRAHDTAPERINAPLSRRDQVKRDQDFVSVVLDPVGQRRSAQFVRISAAGVLADGLFTAADDVEDFAPDFDVEAAVQRLPDGYSVELRWPLAALRFPHSQSAAWRLMVTRSIPREDNVLLVSAPLNQDALSFIAELQEIEGLGDLVEQVRERSFFSVRPELTLRRGQRPSLGAELKWRPRADWVIDATLNPDFAQVELDAPQLAGNTRFALSVPEKRPFFLESTDVVGQSQPDDSGENRSLAAFYSRAITDPDWGLRATWRGASAEATALSLRDAGGGQILRASAYGTAAHAQPGGSQASFARGRLQREAIGVGLLASLRDYGGGRRNEVLGSDFSWALGGTDLLRGHLLASSTTAGFGAEATGEEEPVLLRMPAESGHNLWLSWRRRNEDWANALHLEQVSPRFANDNGFVSQSGFRRVTAQLNRRLGSRDWAGFQAHELELQLEIKQTETLADARFEVPGGELIERQLRPGFWLAMARNTGVWGHLGLDRQRARSGGRLHAPRSLLLGIESNPAPWLTWISAEFEWGRLLDVEADRLGRGANLHLEAKLRSPLPWGLWLELEQQLGQGFVRSDALGRRSFTERNSQTLAVLHLSARDSLRAIVQGSKYRRRAEAGLLEPVDERSRHVSLVFQHRIGLSRILSLGYSQSRERPLQAQHSREVFAKAVASY